MPTDEQVAAACIAAINAQIASYGAAGIHAVDLDDARGVTAELVQVTLGRRFSEAERGGMEAQSPYRLTTRPVADTVSNGREIAGRVKAGLSGARIVAGGKTSTPVRLESEDQIGEDDGRYSGLSTWTFVF